MQEQSLASWFPDAQKQTGTLATFLSYLRRIERNYGDLDDHWARDRLAGLLRQLDYSTSDLLGGRPHQSRLVIRGDAYKVLASARTHLCSYIRFCENGLQQ